MRQAKKVYEVFSDDTTMLDAYWAARDFILKNARAPQNTP